MKVRWIDTIALQDDLIRFWKSDIGYEFGKSYVNARAKDHAVTIQQVRVREGMQTASLAHIQEYNNHEPISRATTELHTIAGARPYWISSEMTQLALHASQTVPRTAYYRTDLPCPNGFAVFEVPLVVPDLHGLNVTVASILWRVIDRQNALIISFYSDPRDPRDDYFGQVVRDGELRDATAKYIGHHMLLTEDVTEFDKPYPHTPEVIAEMRGADPELVRKSMMWMRTFPIALWALMQQRLAVTVEHRPERAVRRRLEKAGSPLSGQTVRAVTLRRLREDVEHVEGNKVDWKQRWIVGGHWRKQWHPSTKTHQDCWIAPFVKGPSDKPLVMKRTIHKLVR